MSPAIHDRRVKGRLPLVCPRGEGEAAGEGGGRREEGVKVKTPEKEVDQTWKNTFLFTQPWLKLK